MFDEENNARWPTLVAGLILLIVLAAVAAMSAQSDNRPDAWRRAEPVVGLVIDRLGGESADLLPACRSAIELVGAFGPAHGTTWLTVEGGFVFHMEVEPSSKRWQEQPETKIGR